MPETAESPSSETVRSALDHMLASPDFHGSERVRRFLSYVVEEKLGGRQHRIKAYNIATSVFGRDESFDPQLDSIVRIEAGRVRQSIERYYLLEGRSDQLQIRIPKGGYVPSFETRPGPTRFTRGETDNIAGSDGVPSILVERLAREGDRSVWPDFADGLARLIVVDLARFHGLRVYSARTARTDVDARSDYMLGGATTVDETRVSVDLALTHLESGRTIWADSIVEHLDSGRLIPLRDKLAAAVARTIGEPFGVINSDRMQALRPGCEDEGSNLEGYVDFYQYWLTFDPTLLERAQLGLEQTVWRHPGDAEAIACLSLIHSNFGRLGDRRGVPERGLEERALTLADRAVRLAPASSWSHYAVGLACWALRDIEGSLDALEIAHYLNPCDRCIAADLGQRYAMLASWDRARMLIGEALTGNVVLPGALRIGAFLHHFAHGRYGQALGEARKIPRQLTFSFAARAAAAIRLGDRDAADAAVRRLLYQKPNYGRQLAEDLKRRNIDDDLAAAVIAALREAGLPNMSAAGPCGDHPGQEEP